MIVFDIIMPAQSFVRTFGALLLFRVDKTLENSFVFFNLQIRI